MILMSSSRSWCLRRGLGIRPDHGIQYMENLIPSLIIFVHECIQL